MPFFNEFCKQFVQSKPLHLLHMVYYLALFPYTTCSPLQNLLFFQGPPKNLTRAPTGVGIFANLILTPELFPSNSHNPFPLHLSSPNFPYASGSSGVGFQMPQTPQDSGWTL